MKKVLLCLILFFALFLFSAFNVNAVGNEAYQIVTTPGADMSTQMNINWHSDVDGSFVELTLASDTNYENSTMVMPDDSYLWSKPATEDGYTHNGFYERTVNSVSLEDLQPETEYKYRVGKTTMSKDYYFKTGAVSGKAFQFVHMTDPQYADAGGASVFNNLMYKVRENNSNIAFTLFSGDVVDRGGIAEQWNILYRQTSLALAPIAVSPGNHEYYDASSTPKTYNASYYNAHYNNPDNGAEGSMNSSYYFKYNNALFISIDSENSTAVENQKQWFADIMEKEHAQYIIVFMHKSFYGSIYSSVSPALQAHWQPLFDKYGVDLVLTGHDHVYTRSYSIYNGEISNDPKLGTTYITGGSAGKKFYDPYDTYSKYYAKTVSKTSVANVISVSNMGLEIQLMNENGDTLDRHLIAPKRGAIVNKTITNQELLDTFKFTADKTDLTKATLSWSTEYYGNISTVKVFDASGNVLEDKYLYRDGLNTLNITGLVSDDVNNFKVSVLFKDGEILEKDLVVDNTPNFGSILNVHIEDGSLDQFNLVWIARLQNDILDKYEVYVNGELYQVVDKAAKSILINGVSPYQENIITLKAFNANGKEIYTTDVNYGEQLTDVVIDVPNDELNVVEGDEIDLGLTVEPDVDVTYKYEISDNSIIDFVNGKLKALKPGTVTITISTEEYEGSATVNIVVEELIIPVEEVSISGQEKMTVGQTIKFEATVTPQNATNKTITWLSSNTTVLTVDGEGNVTAVSEGVAIITAKSDFKNARIVVTVEIDEEPDPEPDPEPNPEPAPKKGCGSKNAAIVVLTLGIVIFFFRRRRLF